MELRKVWDEGRVVMWECQDCRARFTQSRAAIVHSQRLGHYVYRNKPV